MAFEKGRNLSLKQAFIAQGQLQYSSTIFTEIKQKDQKCKTPQYILLPQDNIQIFFFVRTNPSMNISLWSPPAVYDISHIKNTFFFSIYTTFLVIYAIRLFKSKPT